MARLGAEVTQIEMLERIMGREDPEVSATCKNSSKRKGFVS